MGEADRIWWQLGDGDWLEAFGHHPRIGEDPEELRKKFSDTASVASGEQSGVSSASDETLNALAKRNTEYFEKFAHIFIVCATGKSANEMLDILEQRIDNPPVNELRIAAGEQAKITRLRLEKLP